MIAAVVQIAQAVDWTGVPVEVAHPDDGSGKRVLAIFEVDCWRPI